MDSKSPSKPSLRSTEEPSEEPPEEPPGQSSDLDDPQPPQVPTGLSQQQSLKTQADDVTGKTQNPKKEKFDMQRQIAKKRLEEESLSKDMKGFMFDNSALMQTMTNRKEEAEASEEDLKKQLNLETSQLLAAKRRLRPVNRKTHFYPEKLGRRELLKDYDWDMDYLPIPVVRESIRNTSLSADLVSLDFSGIEQLTDFLFYVLKITKSSFPSMEKFVATGCVHLSDQGLTWMSELSPKLAAVEVQGCSRISEKGIHKLALNCPDLHKLIITATSVNRLGSALAETKLSSVTFEGCPMISTSDKFALTTISALKGQEDSGEFWRLPSNKIVVVRDADMDVSVSPLLTGAAPQKSCPTLLYTQDWRPDGEAGEGQGSFNIMEVPSDSVLVDAVISPGSIVLLAFTNNTDNQLCSRLAACLASVLSKCQDCRVGLLAVQEGRTAPSLQLPQILTGIKDTLMNWLQGMNCQFELLTSRQWRLECVDFVNQLSLAAGAADLEVLKRILEKDQIATFTLSKNTPIDKKTLSAFFYKTLKDLYNDFPWLFKQVRKECIDVLSEIKQKTYWNLEKVFHNFPEDAKKMLNHQNSYLHVSSLLKLMNSMGTCLYYPSLRDFPCVSDVQHLAQVLEKLVSTQPPQQVNIKCLGENIPCWETHQLDTLLMEQSLNKVQAQGLTELLVKIGFLLTMTLPENSTKLYVLQFHLPTSPAVDLHNVWREECSDKSAYQGSRYYSFLPGIPLAFFSSLTRELLKLWQPLLLWRSGVLIQQGPVYVLIRLANNIGTNLHGSPVISVQARLPRCKVDPKDISVTNYARQCMFALLNTVCSQVDYLLRKYNVCAFVSTPCLSCVQNNKDPLRREHVFHFDVPSILAGHDRGILCRYEREQRKAKIRADKLLLLGADLPSIVPYHNYSYLCAVKPLVETGDLGEDMAEDESRKKITVSPRISSCCLCIKGEVKLCHHCGMCQKCIHKLAKIEHFVKPSFMTAQLIAIRDVSGKSSRYTTDDSYLVKDHMSTGLTGCVLWPVKGLEYHILQPMTTTYFNTFLLTPVRGSMLAIKLKIKGHVQQLCYHILSGSIDNLNGDVDQDDSWKCRDGYTIMLRLLDSQVSGMVDIVFFLNGQEIWRKAFEICETSVTVSSEVTGTVIVHAPGIKRRQGPEFETGMQVRISTKDRQVSSMQRDRIGEVAPSHITASGLLRLIPVHTPVTSFLLKVTTGEHQNAGTNANIFIQLFGSKNVSKRISLKKTSENMFQRESEDEFRIETSDIGDITCIKLGHDGMNLEDSWFVKSVIVSAPILEYSTSFICNWWLSTQLGDKQLERLFYPQSTDMKGSLQENFNPLSDKLQPLTVQQWRDITGNHDIDAAQLPPLAPSWLFYDIQLQTKPFANMATTLSNVNQFIMPCTQVPLPSAVWCKMMKMRDKLERTLFQYSHIDFSGTSSVLLPQQVREKDVEWPAPELWDAPTNLHPVCYVRGDMSTVVTLRPTYTLPDYMRAFWTAHLLNAPGFPFLLDDDQLITIPILWAWHFVVALNKQFKLQEYQAMFLNAESIPRPEKVSKMIEMYLVQMCYRLFLLLPPDFSLNFFSESNTDLVQKAVGMLRYSLLDNFKETMLEKTRTVFGDDEIFLCSSHLNAWQTSSELSCVPLEKISDYSQYMFTLHLQGNNITCVPKELFCQLPHLKDLDLSSNQIREIPEEIGLCVGMLNLSLKGNNLTELPDSIRNMELLNRFDISNNQMREVPWCVTQLRKLVCLYMRTMQLRSLPEDIGNLTLLEKLYLNENCIHQLPASFKNLKNLTELSLNGVSWVKIKSNTILSKVNFENFLKAANLLHWLSSNEQEKSAIFKYFDENTNGTLEPKEIGKLNATIFYTFPRFGYMGSQVPDEDMPHGFPEEILHLEKLTYLSLQYQAIVAVPDQISRLKNLKVLNLSHNPNLLSLSAQTGSLPLKRLELEDCPLLKTPPKEIRAKGFITTYAYLKRLLSGSVDCKRTKLMMVGLGGAGKTSLVKALLSGNHKAELAVGEEITDGIDICPWKVLTEEGELTFNIWDFAGQTVYYNTHQFFLSDRAIYMLLWNIRLGHEHAGLDFWLSSISVHAPKAPILVIGTHVDQVSKVEIPVKAMKLRYPQIAGFHFVSSHSGQGIGELKSELLEVTLHQSYMGEKIPGAWLTFEEQIISLKDRSVIEYRELEKKANISGIFSQSEVHQAVQFLHELGSLQYFTNEYLKAYVVVNPQWIVDVMACVVSVKDSPIKEGRLNHCDIPLVWRDYPENLHKWLLRLTEEFDLTFPLSSEDVNLVPCLLPEKEPEISLPELDKKGAIRKTKMLYKFDYLPAGLFNRGQVRLHQFSDSALIWKKGSFLNKNKHICLIKQTRESELLVEAQGPRPENIVFLVHEVFETLIMESFHGVTYDYQLPCPDCLKLNLKDPHMFAVSTMRRASELRAPFLQCLQYFHTVSMVELQGMMPPDSNTDYDIHLVQAVQGLKTLSKDLVADIFVSYCGKNVPEDKTSNIYIHPSLVCKDLRKSGYKCWFKEDSIKHATDEMAKALMDAEVFLVFISNEYVNDEECCNLFKYARLTLHKPIILVVVGSGMEWKSSRLGILLADEVFVSMLQVERYKTKFEELLKVIKVRVQKEAAEQQFPPCFISYCWQNSAQAVARGTRPRKGGVGHGDPRAIKQYLDEQGIPCWLDVERVGLHGLFEDIAEGLLQAKLVIVCVSDEYSTSANCCMEFRYAANTLKLPIILAVVGTGNAWRASEIGVLTLKYPLVSFQENNQASYDKLLTKVRELLPHPDTYTPAILQQEKEHADTEEKDLSYQELCELAQRKFLRQIVQYADQQEVEAPYPRLLLLDYVPEKKNEEAGEEAQHSGHEEMFKHPMCIHILCEHDEGWHACSEPLPLSLDLATIEKSIPYIARISAIARYSKILVMNCLATSLGQEFIKWVQESPQVVTFSDFRQIYHDLRQEVINADPQRIMGNLARCHLPNGKLMWLCEEHRNKMRVTVLSDEMTMSSHGSSEPVGVDYMLQALRELDYRQVPSAIRRFAGLEEPQAADTPKKKALHGKLQKKDDPNKSDRPDSKSSHTCSQNTSAQQLVSPAQRSLKTRSSQGNPPQFGNRIKSKACNIM